MNDIDDLISAALTARATAVTDADLRPAEPPTGKPKRVRPGWQAPLLAAAAVVVVAGGRDGDRSVAPGRHTDPRRLEAGAVDDSAVDNSADPGRSVVADAAVDDAFRTCSSEHGPPHDRP